MKQFHASLAVVVLASWTVMAPARAAPPTVTPSPGYDARLQEQRTAPPVVRPGPVARRRVKRNTH